MFSPQFGLVRSDDLKPDRICPATGWIKFWLLELMAWVHENSCELKTNFGSLLSYFQSNMRAQWEDQLRLGTLTSTESNLLLAITFKKASQQSDTERNGCTNQISECMLECNWWVLRGLELGETRWEGLDQYSAICRNSRIIRDRANPSGGRWSRSEVLIIGVPSTIRQPPPFER